MKESPAKAVARELFYTTLLPAWLTAERIKTGNVLILLGEEPRELPYIQNLGIPFYNVFSVEHDPAIYQKQLALNRTNNLQLSLYFGDMQDYLVHMLHMNQAFTILNLDIEGSYINQLDEAMTSVALFCWKNPETVVATHSSVGRDVRMLREGYISALFLLLVCPEETERCFATYAYRYRAAGIGQTSNMILRDLFWLRSIYERMLCASATVLLMSKEISAHNALLRAIWHAICAHGHKPLTLRKARILIEPLRDNIKTLGCFSLPITIERLAHIWYAAEHPWSQRSYYTKFKEQSGLMDLQGWISGALQLLTTTPLTAINRKGILSTHNSTNDKADQSMMLWAEKGLPISFSPRMLKPLTLRSGMNKILQIGRQ